MDGKDEGEKKRIGSGGVLFLRSLAASLVGLGGGILCVL
jgi:hypothetical protein